MFREHSEVEHPDPELLERFMLSRVDPEERRYIVRHLIRGCPRCLEVTRHLWSLGEESEAASLEEIAGPRRLALESPEPPVELALAEEDPAEMAATAARLHAELEATPPARRLLRVRSEERFLTPGLCDRLTEESRAAARLSPSRGIERGELAVAVAEQLDPRRHGTPVVHGARIRAWSWYGDARRRAGDREGAASALTMAEHLVDQGLGDLRDGADVLWLQAALLAEMGQAETAERLLDQALGVYVTLHDAARQARALIDKARLARAAGQVGPAIGLLIEGADLLDRAEDREELAAALGDLLPLQLEAGRGEEARKTARLLRSHWIEAEDRGALARLWRHEGRAALLSGRLDEAEAAFREGERACLEANLGIEASLAWMELSLLYLRAGRLAELRELTAEIGPLLRARGTGTGEAAALVMFQQQCGQDEPRAESLVQLQAYVESALRPRPVARIGGGERRVQGGRGSKIAGL
jgi:tetratricopeptide (TPR) repeat protein